jgi:AcrR family transcriptional regulator
MDIVVIASTSSPQAQAAPAFVASAVRRSGSPGGRMRTVVDGATRGTSSANWSAVPVYLSRSRSRTASRERLVDRHRDAEVQQTAQPGRVTRVHHHLPVQQRADLQAVDWQQRQVDALGAAVFEHMQAAVQRCLDAGAARPGDAFRIATSLWIGLHGVVSLRLSKPGFPWPPVEELVDQILSGLLGLELGGPTPANGQPWPDAR